MQYYIDAKSFKCIIEKKRSAERKDPEMNCIEFYIRCKVISRANKKLGWVVRTFAIFPHCISTFLKEHSRSHHLPHIHPILYLIFDAFQSQDHRQKGGCDY